MGVRRVGMTVAGMLMAAAMLVAAAAGQTFAPAVSMQDQNQAQARMVTIGAPQGKDELFAGTERFAKGASDVTDVNLGPEMLGMVSGKSGGQVARKMHLMVVRSYKYPQPGMYNMKDVDAYRQKLHTGGWNCFIHTSESKDQSSTDICNRALPNNQGSEMVIMTVEPRELTFIHMSGRGSLADLGQLGALGGMMGQLPAPPTPPTPPTPPHP